MIKKYVLAELGDVEIVESDCGSDAREKLLNSSFDLVICDSDLGDMHLTDLRLEAMEASSKNSGVEYIALCGAKDGIDRLVQAGFKNIVNLPFNPVEFVKIINQICNPRKLRQKQRFHIPDSKVVIHVWGMEAEGEMINISLGGVLVEISGDRSELLLQNNPKLTLKIRIPVGSYDIRDLPVKLARLNVYAWNKDSKPIVMRAAYLFQNLSQKAADKLEQIIQLAKEDGLVDDEKVDNSDEE
jgi:CheY-like chemotaxis protein